MSLIVPKPRLFRKPNKKVLRTTYEQKSNKIQFGSFAIQALTFGFLTVYQIEAIRRTITSKLKKKGKIWIRSFPDYARTAKPKEVRMGRGKGNVNAWVAVIKPGRILFEVKSKHNTVIKEALQFALRKLPFKAHVIYKTITL